MRRIVIVGASLAGIAAAEELRLQGFDGELVLVSGEDRRPYDRPPLSKALLAGSVDPDSCLLRPPDWEREFDTEIIFGSPAVALDISARRLVLERGGPLGFEGLVVATGATPIELSAPQLHGVHTLRTVDDTLAIRARLEQGAALVVVGGGFIGCEVAATARGYGGPVTLIEALPAPLERVLGTTIGEAFTRLHRSRGVDVRCGVPVVGLVGSDAVEGVVLADGATVDAQVVVVGLGVRPNTAWLNGSGLTLQDGLVCDPSCTAAPMIVAAGDVVRWNHPWLGSVRLEHWDNALGQGRAAAISLLQGGAAQPFAPIPYVWSDQYDRRLQLVGYPKATDQPVVVSGTLEACDFVALYERAGRLSAGIAINQPRAIRMLRQLLGDRATFDVAVATFAA